MRKRKQRTHGKDSKLSHFMDVLWRMRIHTLIYAIVLNLLSGCADYEMQDFLYFSKVDKEYQALAQSDGFNRRRGSLPLFGHERCCNMSAKKSRGIVYRHAPYAHHACQKCHSELKQLPNITTEGQKVTLAVPKEQLCLQCHQAIKETPKFPHGPIGVGECLCCHTPHISYLDSLLRLPDRKMCFTCHAKKDIAKGKYHSSIGNRGCLECHYPHGGDVKFFLKPTHVQTQHTGTEKDVNIQFK